MIEDLLPGGIVGDFMNDKNVRHEMPVVRADAVQEQ
jgi:hypothetical protein